MPFTRGFGASLLHFLLFPFTSEILSQLRLLPISSVTAAAQLPVIAMSSMISAACHLPIDSTYLCQKPHRSQQLFGNPAETQASPKYLASALCRYQISTQLSLDEPNFNLSQTIYRNELFIHLLKCGFIQFVVA